VKFHAGTARIGKNAFDPFAFEGLDQNITAACAGSKFTPLIVCGCVLPRGGGLRFCAHISVLFYFDWRCRANKKPTTVSSRGLLLKFKVTSNKHQRHRGLPLRRLPVPELVLTPTSGRAAYKLLAVGQACFRKIIGIFLEFPLAAELFRLNSPQNRVNIRVLFFAGEPAHRNEKDASLQRIAPVAYWADGDAGWLGSFPA
jgi:hypothetical protein